MVVFSRINSEIMTERLDAEFYKPVFLLNEKKLKSCKEYSYLSKLLEEFQLGYTGPTEQFYASNGVNYLSSKNIINGFIDITNATDTINPTAHETVLSKTAVKSGDVLIARTGNVGKSAVVSESLGKANIAAHLIALRLNLQSDSYFISSFLNTDQGMLQSERHQRGTIIQGLSVYDIPNFIVPIYSSFTQKYIGDKVRQAERLRALGKRLELQLDQFLLPYQPAQKTPSSLVSRVSSVLLTDMLTATTYRDHYVNNQKNLKTFGKTLSLFDLLNSVTNGFDERTQLDEGLTFVKVADVKPGYIEIRNAPKVRLSALDEASLKQKPKLGDLLLTRKGSFGIAAVVMESTDFLCSSEVFCCKPTDKEFMPILAWFLNSDAGNMQFWQFSTGTTMPGINQENLANIVIPDFSTVDLTEFNQMYELRYLTKKYSELLTISAKLLVEALIENQIDESRLITAQEQLQVGNDTVDRVILSRLKTDGFDGKGQTLFAGLDQMYALLAQT